MAETELLFSVNDIKQNGKGYKSFDTDMTLGEFKEKVEFKITEIKMELEEISSLYLKTNTLLETELNKENDWKLEL